MNGLCATQYDLVEQFCDSEEKVTRHPMSPSWPESMLTTIQFAEEEPNQTRITVTWEPYGIATHEEIQTFINAKGGMTEGWTGSFDKLESLIAS